MITREQIQAAMRRPPLWLVCLLVSILLAIAAYYFTDQETEAVTTKDEKLGEVDRMTRNLMNAKGLKEDQQALNALFAQMESRMADPGNLPRNLEYFYRIGDRTGVRIASLQPLPAEELPSESNSKKRTTRKKLDKLNSDYVVLPFRLTVTGTFAACMAFLSRVESGEILCSINTYNLQRASDTEVTFDFQANLLAKGEMPAEMKPKL